jgi:hypothetical protein
MAKFLTALIPAIVKGTHPTELKHQLTALLPLIDAADMDRQAVIAALGTTTNITSVPGSFADLAAVQAYLAGANMVPNIETRLDNLEAKLDAILAALKASGLIASA